MKIAYCVPIGLHHPSGMERVLTCKANWLATHGCEVHIILTDITGEEPAFPLDKAVHIHQLNVNLGETRPYRFLKRAWLDRKKIALLKRRLNECLCQIRPDITISVIQREIDVISQMADGSIKIGEAHFPKEHIWNFVNYPARLPNSIRSLYNNHCRIRFLRKLSRFIVLTNEDAAAWRELNNVSVIPNPIPFVPKEVSSCTNKQVIAAGRYHSQKGFDRLIAAWKLVVEKHPDWILKIYGDGGLREQLTTQVAVLGLQNNCLLEHTTKDVSSKFRESSVFVLSSRFEGFGLVIVEAMACGLPVVSYTCPCGPRDIITEGTDGLLVNEGDIAGLADGINRLIEDEDLRRAMGKKAQLKAEQYSMERIGKQWMDLFESLIKQKECGKRHF